MILVLMRSPNNLQDKKKGPRGIGFVVEKEHWFGNEIYLKNANLDPNFFSQTKFCCFL